MPLLATVNLIMIIVANFTSDASRTTGLVYFVADAAAGCVFIGLLSIAVLGPLRPLHVVGNFALGIYLGHTLWWTQQPDGTRTFGITVRGHIIVPTLQQAIEWAAGNGFLQVFLVILYTALLVSIAGVPFHFAYMEFLKAVQGCAQLAK